MTAASGDDKTPRLKLANTNIPAEPRSRMEKGSDKLPSIHKIVDVELRHDDDDEVARINSARSGPNSARSGQENAPSGSRHPKKPSKVAVGPGGGDGPKDALFTRRAKADTKPFNKPNVTAKVVEGHEIKGVIQVKPSSAGSAPSNKYQLMRRGRKYRPAGSVESSGPETAGKTPGSSAEPGDDSARPSSSKSLPPQAVENRLNRLDEEKAVEFSAGGLESGVTHEGEEEGVHEEISRARLDSQILMCDAVKAEVSEMEGMLTSRPKSVCRKSTKRYSKIREKVGKGLDSIEKSYQDLNKMLADLERTSSGMGEHVLPSGEDYDIKAVLAELGYNSEPDSDKDDVSDPGDDEDEAHADKTNVDPWFITEGAMD